MTDGSNLLTVNGITVTYDGVVALDRVGFSIREGDICGLIGPNGAGKTTLFNVISGIQRPSAGSVQLRQTELLALKPHRIAAAGIARTFQNLALAPSLTALENVLLGEPAPTMRQALAWAAGLPSARRQERRAIARADEILDLLDLSRWRDQVTSGLPFGVRKRLEIARSLMSRPQLLMLDEPAAGLNHTEVLELTELISQVRAEFGLTVLLVEHHMAMVMAIAPHLVVLNFGRKIADGDPDQIRNDPGVVRAYLGDDGVVDDR